jgi:hypothetical protein
VRKVLWRLRRWWHRRVYGVQDGIDGMMAEFGRGRFVSVFRRGPYIDIVSHEEPKGTIRLIPYQPNHGVMVESRDEAGRVRWRTHMNYGAFCERGFDSQERRRKGD